jgi:hypothetical protein
MKASNFVTPRTTGECVFIPSADPIERPETRSMSPLKGVLWIALILVVASAAVACH